MTVCKPVRRLYYKESTGYTVMIYETEEEIPTQQSAIRKAYGTIYKRLGGNCPIQRSWS